MLGVALARMLVLAGLLVLSRSSSAARAAAAGRGTCVDHAGCGPGLYCTRGEECGLCRECAPRADSVDGACEVCDGHGGADRTTGRRKRQLGGTSVVLAPIFADGFVLQDYYMYDSRSFIFGRAAPAERVALTLTHDANTSISRAYACTADATTGRWIVQIDPDYFNAIPAGQVPDIGARTLKLTVAGSGDGFEHVHTVLRVRYGDVFLCAGGAEMARPLSASVDGEALLAAPPEHVQIFAEGVWRAASEMQRNALEGVSATCVLTAVALSKLSRVYSENRTVALVQATAAASISTWRPGAPTFDRLLLPLAHYALRGILWSHGVEDLMNNSISRYGEELADVVESVNSPQLNSLG